MGIFLVKSAYHLAKEGATVMQAECFEKGEFSGLWKILWKLRVPNSKKKFLWRACNEILPTKANLCRRKIMNDLNCSICGL